MTRPARVRLRVPIAPGAAPQSLCATLDQLLDTGIVAAGEIRIRVADVDLLYVALEVVACSWDTATRLERPRTAASRDRLEPPEGRP